MINRRSNYRHSFLEGERICVELKSCGQPPCVLGGEIVDLSINGMAVQLSDSTIELTLEDRFSAVFRLASEDAPLSFDCVVVHCKVNENPPTFGFQFLPLPDPVADARREKTLWIFLMEQQRLMIRRNLRDTAPNG